MTGNIDPIIARVNSQERMNRKINETMIKIRDLKNIETFVDNPS